MDSFLDCLAYFLRTLEHLIASPYEFLFGISYFNASSRSGPAVFHGSLLLALAPERLPLLSSNCCAKRLWETGLPANCLAAIKVAGMAGGAR